MPIVFDLSTPVGILATFLFILFCAVLLMLLAKLME